MKKLIFSLLFILLCFCLTAQFNYKLKDYKSNIKASETFSKGIKVNDIVVDTTWFYNRYLTNTKVFSLKGRSWTANTKKNVETLSSIIRSNIHNSNAFQKTGENDHSSDFILDTYIQFWNSSLSGNMVYSGIGALVELKDKAGHIIWNRQFYSENFSMVLKRKIVVQQFIDQLLNELMSLNLDKPEFRKLQHDINNDSSALVVFFGNNLNDSKKVRNRLETKNSLEDFQRLQGSDYISDYFIFYFKGNQITRVDLCFDSDHNQKTSEDQYYRKHFFDSRYQIISVIDIEHKGKFVRLLPPGQTYDSESIKNNIDNLIEDDAELKVLEDKYVKSGKENILKVIREERAVISELIAIYRKEKSLIADIAVIEKEFWSSMFSKDITVFEYSKLKVFRYFY